MRSFPFCFAIILVFLAGCQDNPKRHFELGNWYYEKGLIDDAILEYKDVIRLYPSEPSQMTREELNVVMKAHYNLAVAFSKKGFYEIALKEAQKAFDLWPSDDTRELVEVLKKRRSLEQIKIETEP